MEAGRRSPEEMMKDFGTGLLVTEFIGSTINMVTGDYSRGASGFWIENGERAYPVSGITVAGNLRDMFKALEPASDLIFRGSTNVPSCFLGDMTIAGL
jgi:PmbA protein